MNVKQIETGAKITNQRGAWAILRNDPNGGIYYSGVWYAEVWAPDFPAHITSHQLTPNKSPTRVEKGIRQWLANR